MVIDRFMLTFVVNLKTKDMRFYNTFKRGNGDLITQEWSAKEVFDYDLLKFCFIAAVGSILVVLASGICLLARIWDYEEDEKQPSFYGIAFAFYFMLDYHFGWFLTFILKMFEDAHALKLMATCNLALLLTHILLLIFGDTLFFNIEDEEARKPVLVIYTIVTLVLTYLVSMLIF